MKSKKLSSNLFGYILILPAMLAIMIVRIYPLFQGIWMSFTNTTFANYNNSTLIGLENYSKLFKDAKFFNALEFTFLYTFSVVAVSYIIGLFLALLLNREMKMRGVFRTLSLVPWIIPGMVACSNLIWILNDRYGIVNAFLQYTGLIKQPIYFLSDTGIVRYVVIAIGIWRNFSFMMVVLLAGLQSIPLELYECAKVEGSNFINSFRYITMPMLKRVSFICVTLTMIWVFNDFDTIYFLTEGGPVNHTMVIPIYTYNMAFYRTQIGYASAVAVVMSVIMVVFSIINEKVSQQDD